MAKGVSVTIKTYNETIPKLLEVIKFADEIKKYEKIVFKPNLANGDEDKATKAMFVEPIIKFCMEHKNPGTEIIIAEGANGVDTFEVFNSLGYTNIAEKYGIGLVDLNESETDDVEDYEFLKFDTIKYPKILQDGLLISLPLLRKDDETDMAGSFVSMLGAFPAKEYKGFFSKRKTKLDKYPVEMQIHDIIKCRMPDLSIIDASKVGSLFAGNPFEMDKQAARILGFEWEKVAHLKLWNDSITGEIKRDPPKIVDEDDDE